jgi:hypothetical protein
MAEVIPLELHPVMVIEGIYSGVFSGGKWIAVCQSDRMVEGSYQADWITENGPRGCDLEAGEFWSNPPEWVATGATPEAAIDALLRQRI